MKLFFIKQFNAGNIKPGEIIKGFQQKSQAAAAATSSAAAQNQPSSTEPTVRDARAEAFEKQVPGARAKGPGERAQGPGSKLGAGVAGLAGQTPKVGAAQTEQLFTSPEATPTPASSATTPYTAAPSPAQAAPQQQGIAGGGPHLTATGTNKTGPEAVVGENKGTNPEFQEYYLKNYISAQNITQMPGTQPQQLKLFSRSVPVAPNEPLETTLQSVQTEKRNAQNNIRTIANQNYLDINEIFNNTTIFEIVNNRTPEIFNQIKDPDQKNWTITQIRFWAACNTDEFTLTKAIEAQSHAAEPQVAQAQVREGEVNADIGTSSAPA